MLSDSRQEARGCGQWAERPAQENQLGAGGSAGGARAVEQLPRRDWLEEPGRLGDAGGGLCSVSRAVWAQRPGLTSAGTCSLHSEGSGPSFLKAGQS